MAVNKVKFKIKGHESFHLREGWLRKGMKNIHDDSKFFSNEAATDILGVGSNMVKSIRYWLKACGLSLEKIEEGNKRIQILTEGFGKTIFQNDPYFEDIFSLWITHYKISTNKELSTAWYLFFNQFQVKEFTKDELMESMQSELNKFTNDAQYSEKSLHDDCNCIIKTYCLDGKEEKNPEESTICPFTELGLVEKHKTFSGKEYYIKKKPSIDRLDKLVVFYIILDRLKDERYVSIDNVLNAECNAGKILNLDRNILNEYLDALKSDGYIEITRTAGLDTIYINKRTAESVLKEYYEQT